MLSVRLIAALLFIPLAATLPAQQAAADHLGYDIPANAVKTGDGAHRDHSTSYHYVLPGDSRRSENLVGRETYFEEHLVKRELFKNGVRHGLQQTWHRNGVLKSESPFRAGVMHGTFREWNEKGWLIAQYPMVQGKGRKRLYNDAGLLMIDEPMEQGRKHGLCMLRSGRLGILSLFQIRQGALVGKACSFAPNSQLLSLVCLSATGALHGPCSPFPVQVRLLTKSGFSKTRNSPAQTTPASPQRTQASPPYFEDVTIYQELVDARMKDALEAYRRLPLVKIPLEPDAAGNPAARP